MEIESAQIVFMSNGSVGQQSTKNDSITEEDFLDETRFEKRDIRIASDPVGYGFVIRGDGPCYVKVVDPTGPAASAGLKEGHYIYAVNYKPVVKMHHKQLAHVILASNGYVRLTVYAKRDN